MGNNVACEVFRIDHICVFRYHDLRRGGRHDAQSRVGSDNQSMARNTLQSTDKNMNRSVIKILLSAATIACLSSQFASAAATPEIDQFFYPGLLDAKMKVGQDGNIRLIWDFVAGTAYSGSVLWILNPSGSVVAVGNPSVPASVGFGKQNESGKSTGIGSNIMLYAQPSGNTTLAFAFDQSNDGTTFGVWTYNSAGALIASASYGPFGGTVIHQMYFDDLTGKLVVKWRNPISANNFTHTVWTLNEFGSVETTAGPFGPYPNSLLGKVVLSGSNQIWYWSVPKLGSTHGLNTWEINSAGTVISASSFGPF
jgi:hypothetical protein